MIAPFNRAHFDSAQCRQDRDCGLKSGQYGVSQGKAERRFLWFTCYARRCPAFSTAGKPGLEPSSNPGRTKLRAWGNATSVFRRSLSR